MISNNAKQSFNQMFMQGMKAGMLASPDDHCEVETLSEAAGLQDTNVVVLTITSFLFRVIVLIYFTPNEATKSYYARLKKINASDMDDAALIDAICESANLCAGALNRELVQVFPHVGMSTPNILDSKCIEYLEAGDYGHIQHYAMLIDSTSRIHAGIYVRGYGDLDFSIDVREAESTGELELF